MKHYGGKKILVEGWRDIPHSYAIANQFQCLEMLRRPGLELRHRDMRYFSGNWRAMSGLFDAGRERLLHGIQGPLAGECFDAVLRMDFPHRVEPAEGRTCVFMTCEFGRIETANVAGSRPLAQEGAGDVVYVTPSKWSERGVLQTGVGRARVAMVPLGVDAELFHPATAEARAAARERMKLGSFTFAHMGAMTSNKNVPLLLKAFAAVLGRHPEARLILKGLESLYQSRQLVQGSGGLLTPEEVALVLPRVVYTGSTLSYEQMAEVYQSVDAYVAPYSAEGFNLPVLEAIACGTPVICTAGGPTDDFTTAEFALRVESTERSFVLSDGKPGIFLEPSLESLIGQMLAVIEKPEIAERVLIAGPRFVAEGFLWSQVVDRLLAVMLD